MAEDPEMDPEMVQASEEAWRAMIQAVRTWASRYMDQWERIALPMEDGKDIYLVLSHVPDHLSSFEAVDADGNPRRKAPRDG